MKSFRKLHGSSGTLRIFLVAFALGWSCAASAINGVQVRLDFCVTHSGTSDPSPPYFGSAGHAPNDWEAAVQLGCIRFAAAHRTCPPGNNCSGGLVCSSVIACRAIDPPFSPNQVGNQSAFGRAFHQMRDNLVPTCEIGTSFDRILSTCGCPGNAGLGPDGGCYCNDGLGWDPVAGVCVAPANCPGSIQDGLCNRSAVIPGKNCTVNCPDRGDVTAGTNPINVGTGMKVERDVLYRSASGQELSIEFVFLSSSTLAPLPEWVGLLGRNRVSPFDRAVRLLGNIGDQDRVAVTRPDGRRFEFRGPPGSGSYAPDQDIADRIERLTNAAGGGGGWKLTAAGGDLVELYDAQPLQASLLAVSDRQGRTQRFSYADGAGGIRFQSGSPSLGFAFTAPACSPPAGWVYQLHTDGTNAATPAAGRLLCVTDHWGRQLHFQYDSRGRARKIANPAGEIYEFHYDGASGGCAPHAFDNLACAAGNLTSVVLPDGTVRTWHYNEPAQINAGAACPGKAAYSPGRGHLPYHLTGLEDENGVRFASWTYDCQGRATSSEHAGGASKITIGYDAPASGQRTVTDFRLDAETPNQRRTYDYATSLGVVRNTAVSEACDHCRSSAALAYDANGNVASRTDFNGNRTDYTHDLLRNLETSRTEGLTSSGGATQHTRTISTQWHPTFRLPAAIAEPLRITTSTYDADGSQCGARGALCSRTIQATTDADGSLGFSATPSGAPRSWKYAYNRNGDVLAVDGPRTDVPDVTTYTYYADDDPDPGKRGNVATISNAAGHLTRITAYNAHGQPLSTVDANGLTVTMAYDARQRLKTRTVGGETTAYDYDGVGQLTKVTLADGSFLSYRYDDAHRLTGMEDNLGNRVAYTLDLMGNRIREQVLDPASQLAQTRSRVFNNLSRLSQELGAQNQTTEYAYDSQGNVLTVKDPLSRMTSNHYDALNRLRQVTDPALGVTRYAYNGLDALTQVTDPRSLVTRYTVDGLGNLIQQASPDTGTTVNAYDAAGNLLAQTDAKGQTTTYKYDALNRVTLIAFHDGARQTYAYDQGPSGIGRLSSITETDAASKVSSVIAYAYDQHGRVTSETRTVEGIHYVLAYTYDRFGRLTGLGYPSGRTVSYALDGLGRVSQVTTAKDSETQTVVQAVQYHPFGGVRSYTLGNGQVYTRGIDLDGRVSSYTLGSQSFAIGYDAASRIAFISDIGNPANTNTYAYDELDRLTAAALQTTPYAYSYDAVGNRLSRTAGSSIHAYAYSPTSNRIASITPSSGAVRNFVFDANGSTTADGLNAYTYDARGRMVQAASSLGTTSYQVNALGQRVRKTNASGDTVYHYDTRGRLIAETGPGGALKRELIYLGDIPVGVVQ